MNIDILKEILAAKNMTFTLKEIEEMMDEELEKDPSEMDVDLINTCADVLVKAHEEIEQKNNKRNKRKNVRKILLVAAITAIFGMTESFV